MNKDFVIVAILTAIALIGYLSLLFTEKSTAGQVLPFLTILVGYLVGRKAPKISVGIGKFFGAKK